MTPLDGCSRCNRAFTARRPEIHGGLCADCWVEDHPELIDGGNSSADDARGVLGSTHWDECWRVHIDCAVVLIEKLTGKRPIDQFFDEFDPELIDGDDDRGE